MAVSQPHQVLANLAEENARYRVRLARVFADGAMVTAVVSVLIGWNYTTAFDKLLFLTGGTVCLFANLLIRRGEVERALSALAVISVVFFSIIALTSSYAAIAPLYFLPVMAVAALLIEQKRLRIGVVMSVCLGGVALRITHDLLVKEDLEMALSQAFDTTAILVIMGVLLLVHRDRWERDHTHLREALLNNQHLVQSSLTAAQLAKEASETKGMFLERVSHELRTPLNAILGYAELIEEEELMKPEGQEDLEAIQTAGQNLLGLVDDLLDISALDEEWKSASKSPIDLVALVNEVVESFEPHLLQSSTVLRTHLPSQLTFPIHERGLRQILRNLVSNAIRFTDAGRIDVDLQVLDDGCLQLLVTDTGQGIHPNHLSRVFEPFVQGADVQYARGGVGLGLTICRRYATGMGATLEVESTVGEGSTFRFCSPPPT